MTAAKANTVRGAIVGIVVAVTIAALLGTTGTLFAMHGRLTRVETRSESDSRRLGIIEQDVKTLLRRVPGDHGDGGAKGTATPR